jgi:HEAT repeat protein
MTVVSRVVSDAAFEAFRKIVDESGYGSFVSDENARAIGDAVAVAAVRAALQEAGARIIDPEQPYAPGG